MLLKLALHGLVLLCQTVRQRRLTLKGFVAGFRSFVARNVLNFNVADPKKAKTLVKSSYFVYIECDFYSICRK